MGLVVLTIHLVVCVCLIGLVLLQRSEGGALGMGGGGGGALMSGRGAADALAKMTSVAGGFFIVTSLTLTMLSGAASTGGRSVMDLLPATQTAPATTAPATTETPAAPATTTDPTEGRVESPTQLVSLGPSEAAAATPPPAAATTRAGPIENRTTQQAAATQRQITPASTGATTQRTTPTTTPQRSAPQTTPASTQPAQRQAPPPATTGNAVGGIDLTTDNQLGTESSDSANDGVAAVRRERAGPDQ
ncbi:MAG: preprotein translocase subunit SecG [Terricaulis sp.]